MESKIKDAKETESKSNQTLDLISQQKDELERVRLEREAKVTAVGDEELKQIMKENGIGRPSTRANIIETLYRRKYIEKKKRNILPTETGIKLIQLIDNPTLKSPRLTGQWEKKIKDIESGTYTSSEFIGEMRKLVKEFILKNKK